MTSSRDARGTKSSISKEDAPNVNGKAKVSQRAEQNVAIFGLA
jgi:hypothetical protein